MTPINCTYHAGIPIPTSPHGPWIPFSPAEVIQRRQQQAGWWECPPLCPDVPPPLTWPPGVSTLPPAPFVMVPAPTYLPGYEPPQAVPEPAFVLALPLLALLAIRRRDRQARADVPPAGSRP